MSLRFFTYFYIFLQSICYADMTTPPKSVEQQFFLFQNVLKNPGAELGRTQWTASGGTFAVTNSSPLDGAYSFTWDSNASGQTLSSEQFTVPLGLQGRNGLGQIKIQVASGTATHTLEIFDGTNILATQTITSNIVATFTRVNFIFPSSGTVRLRLKSVNANEPLIKIDSAYLGDASNITDVGQATFFGSAKTAATTNCQWQLLSASWANFPADTDCPTPTVTGFASAPATKIPSILFASLPPGDYLVIANGTFEVTGGTSASWAMSDGTTRYFNSQQSPGSSSRTNSIIGHFSYTTAQTNISFQPQAYELGGSTANINVNDTTVTSDYQIAVYRYPSTTEIAVRTSSSPQSWSGYHDNTCSWARTNTAYGDPTADASCALVERFNNNFGSVTTSGGVLPAITFTPSVAGGFYYVCAVFKGVTGTNNAFSDERLWDGTTVISETEQQATVANDVKNGITCGVYRALTTSATTLSLQTKSTSGAYTIQSNSTNTSSVEWSIVNISKSLSTPLLVGSITSNSTGTERMERAVINNTGAACTVTSQSGSWVGTLTRNGTGRCSWAITTGIFASAPTCTCSPQATSVGGQCAIDNGITISATNVGFVTTNAAGTNSDFGATHIQCMGQR